MHDRKRRAGPPALALAVTLLWVPATAGANEPPKTPRTAEEFRNLGNTGNLYTLRSLKRFESRRINGKRNNPWDRKQNAAHTQLEREVASDYGDGLSSLAGAHRESARHISNAVVSQAVEQENPYNATDYLWQWGQFLDHDIDLTPAHEPHEPANIAVPTGDPSFDPFFTGTQEIPLNRSLHDEDTGIDSPREQFNLITGWIDASNVYGSDRHRARELRTLDGTGKLKTSAGNLLPFNVNGLENDPPGDPSFFLAGDIRANEQAGLAAMHTLFVREHNRLAEKIKQRNPRWGDRRIYEHARRIVGAYMQAITYEEFLPALLGPDAMPRYRGYKPWKNARIRNIFSTAAYRFGHSALSPTLLRLEADGSPSPYGHLALRDAFFDPTRITDEGGIEPVLRGLAAQLCQKVDHQIVDDVRNFLFGPPGSGGLDLASLNIQRGRDHGLPSYNDVREAFGFGRAATFADVHPDPAVQANLAAAYATPDDIDLWVGGLAEEGGPQSHVGPLFKAIIAHQFALLRDGDRFYYERVFRPAAVREIKRHTLAEIIRRNTDIGDEIQDDVFRLPNP